MRIFGFYFKLPSSHSYEAFALRTCLSVTVVACLTLFTSTQRILSHYEQNIGSLGITALLTALVKDRTVGTTILNGLACIIGAMVAGTVCKAVLVISGDYYGQNVAIALIPIFSLLGYIIQFQGTVLALAIELFKI